MKEQALQLLNGVLEADFSTIQEAEEFLTEHFQEAYARCEEAQLAFDDVDTKMGGLLGQYFVYTLSADGETWHVDTGESFKEADLPIYIEAFEAHYGESFASLDDLTSKLEYRVMKDMSNAGCDAFTALSMILEEDLLLPAVFAIIGADSEPRIEWADFDTI